MDGQDRTSDDQTPSDRDQTLSDHDQTLSDRDQRDSDDDQEAADAAPGEDADEAATRARTTASRAATTRARKQTGDARDANAAERDRNAEARDDLAAQRDLAANITDEISLALQASEGPLDLPRLEREAAARRRAANAREHAAGDRRNAARDRENAARDRERAIRDRERAGTDELTGARRRGVGLEDLEREIERARRTGQPLAAAYVDVDGLKEVNDGRGHGAGDDLLRTVAAALRDRMRSYDLLVRLGGDEFVCVLVGVTLDQARERLAQLNAGLAPRSVSVGLTDLRADDDPRGLIERADRDLLATRSARAR